MQCLFCGKGIGPIRQLRDAEFCSEAHRAQHRERYRQQAYAALAPEPAPTQTADFIGQTPVTASPAPTAVLCTLPKPLSGACLPVMDIAAAGFSMERPEWIFGQRLAAMPTRLVWHGSAVASAWPAPAALFAMRIQLPQRSPAGAAAPHLAAANSAVGQPHAAPRISATGGSMSHSVTLPEAAPMQRSPAGAAAPHLAAANSAVPQPHAAPRISATGGSVSHPVTLPEAAPIPAPVQAEPAASQLRAAMPGCGEPAAVGPVPTAIHTAITLPGGATIGVTTALPGPLSAAVAGEFSPAAIAARPRPLEGGPLPFYDLKAALHQGLPVAFEAQGRPHAGIVLPTPPTLAAPTAWSPAQQPEPRLSAAAAQSEMSLPSATRGPVFTPALDFELAHANPPAAIRGPLRFPAAAVSEVRPMALAPMDPTADPQPAALPPAAPSWHDKRAAERAIAMGSLGSHGVPRVEIPAAPVGALAGLVQSGNAPVQEAAGNRNPRPDMAHSAARIQPPAERREPSVLLAGAGSAALRTAAALEPAAPPKAVPSWDAARVVSQDYRLVPLADVALPRIDCLPAPAGVVDGVGAWRPDMGRALRSCAVLWTLHVGRIRNPPFRMDPVRVRFSDLLRSGREVPYSQDVEEKRPAKATLRPFKLDSTAPSRKQKWQYIGAAAAALLLAVALRPLGLPKLSGPSVPWRGVSVRQWMSQRATRDFADDFRAGLSQWKGVQPAWPKSWRYNTDGFMHPGQLALYRPSVPLSDYKFEFMAQIESKSVDWVVRAHDAENYYALKFTVLQPGPRPMLAMVRYPVIGGHKGARVQTPLRMMIHANTPYRVTVDVKGNQYRAYIEDQEADFWTDDSLKTGGVGFFSEAGEHARVYWVKLESHGDVLGRICGLLSGKSSEGATDKETKAMDYRHGGITEINKVSSAGVAEAAVNTAQEARISRVLSKAASLHLDGKLEESAKELSRALDGGERHAALYFALGQLQYELQQYAPAAQSYAQAALLQPLHPTAHFNAGVCLGRVEHWEEAAAAFRKAISNDPTRSEAHLALGACLVQLGLHNEALDAYDHFLDRHPDHEEALFGKAVALQKRDRSGEAVELYRRILAHSPHNEEALGNLVSLSLANQDYEQVRKYAQRLAEAQPKSQIALEGLAGAAFAAGDHRAAADYSRQLAELAPKVFENWFNLGVACHKAGDLANASKAYARATRVQPDSPQAHLNLGVSLQEQGDLKAARAAYERALEIDPKLAGVHWNLGLVQEQLGDLPAAEKLYGLVPQNSPDSDDAAFRIGHLRLQRADYPGSIQAFEACLEKRPNWPEARLNLGIAHWRAGDKEQARVCFQELTASGGDSREALRGLAALSLEHQEYDKAFEIYRQLLDTGERSPELLYNAGLICQRRGEPEDAVVLYREAIKADPSFGEALLNLGHALMSLGNEFEARSCWRKAVIAKPELAQRYFEPAAQAS